MVPVTGTGPRVRDVREQGAEGDDRGDLEFSGEAEDLADELLPLHVRLDALHQDDVAGVERDARYIDARVAGQVRLRTPVSSTLMCGRLTW